MKIAEGIHIVDGADHCRLYLLGGAGDLTLIDAGDPGDGPKVLAYLEKQGWKPADIKRIILTHKHGDHVADLKMLVEATGAKVYAHEADADEIDKISKVDVRLKDGDVIEGVLGGLQVVHTPGHTMGCILLYSPSRRALFSGDSILTRGEVSGPVPAYCVDLALAYQSLKQKVPPLEFDILGPGHGDPMSNNAGPIVKQVVARLGT